MKKKVLMTSEKTWIDKDEWDFQKKHIQNMQREFWEPFMLDIERKIFNLIKTDEDAKNRL